MRARVATAAFAGTFAALSLAAVALHFVVATTLLSQVDEVITNRALDITDGYELTGVIDNAWFPFDEATFVGVIEPSLAGEERSMLSVHNDQSPDVDEILDVIDAASFDYEVPVDARLPSLDATTGADNLRLVAVPSVDGELIVVVAQSLDGVDRTTRVLDAFSLVSVPLLAGAVGLLVWVLAGQALGPVEAMRREVEAISKTADLDRRVASSGQAAELQRLGETMNAMLARLAAGQKRERSFASDAAHELRSPLAAIAAQLDVDRAHPDTADHARTTQVLRHETARLQRLVDDLLLLARSGSADVSEHRLVDLDDIVAVSASSIACPDGIVLTLPPFSGVQARGNTIELERAVTNLVANAVRHAASVVRVSIEEVDGSVGIWVEDDGAGIPEADRQRIFERFTRLDEARSRDQGGSGLGLALASEIAQRHGGRVIATTSQLGGAAFLLQLPAG